MREILFRGKCLNNEWVEGYYVESFSGIPFIFTLHDHILNIIQGYEVIPETVGQFTGLIDKYGTMVFGGDIVKLANSRIWYVSWDAVHARWGRNTKLLCRDKNLRAVVQGIGTQTYIEVLGNIYDNPELLSEDVSTHEHKDT